MLGYEAGQRWAERDSRVATLEQAPQSAGAHEVSWNTTGVVRGMYFYRLQSGSVTVTKSVLILK